jgi:hypothetical protein
MKPDPCEQVFEPANGTSTLVATVPTCSVGADELPLPVKIFVIWLTVYQRETDAGAPPVT